MKTCLFLIFTRLPDAQQTTYLVLFSSLLFLTFPQLLIQQKKPSAASKFTNKELLLHIFLQV